MADKKFQVVNFENSRPLLTLAAETGIIQSLTDDLATEGYYAVSMDIAMAIENFDASDGPIDVWVKSRDWTLAEFGEYLLNATTFSRVDLRQKEIAARGRTIKHIGMITNAQPSLHDGDVKRIKLGLYIPEGQSLDLVYFNTNDALMTTGAIVNSSGKMYGRWAN